MADPQQEVTIVYTNWRGETGRRRIRPLHVAFENNEWHPETQWLLYAIDLDKGAERTFAMANIHQWQSGQEIEQLRTLLRAARKHVDPVIQYRLIEAIDAAIGNKRTSS